MNTEHRCNNGKKYNHQYDDWVECDECQDTKKVFSRMTQDDVPCECTDNTGDEAYERMVEDAL